MTGLELIIFALIPTIAWGIGIVFVQPPDDFNHY